MEDDSFSLLRGKSLFSGAMSMLVVGRVIFPIVALFCFCKLHRVRWRSDMRRGDAVCFIVGKAIIRDLFTKLKHQGTLGCTPNSAPTVFIVFSKDSWGL